MRTEVEPSIIANRIITPDGTILQSFNRHDFKSHVDANGFTYSVDGGTSYLKRSWSPGAPAYTDASVYSDDSHELIRDALHWGTYGKNGDEPLSWVKLKDMDTDHIKACLKTQLSMRLEFRVAFENELKFRGGYLRAVVDVQEDENGDCFIELPPELLAHAGLQAGDTLRWTDNKDGSWSLTKSEDTV
jgi:hypothetical protein